MINNSTLVGRLSKDVDLRYTGSGIAVANFTLAVDRNYKNAQGEIETDFINCVIWRAPAENLSNFAVKGSLIGITGAIQTRTYEHDQKGTVYITEVVADNFQLLEPKSVTDERRNKAHSGNQQFNQGNNQSNNQNSTQSNFSGNNSSFNQDNDPFENNPDIADISDDDLPF